MQLMRKLTFFTLKARKTDNEIVKTDDNQLKTNNEDAYAWAKGKTFLQISWRFLQSRKWEENEKDKKFINMDRIFIKGHKQAITSLNWSLNKN